MLQKRLLKSYLRKIKGKAFAVTFRDGDTEIFGADGDVSDSEDTCFRMIINEKLNLSDIMSSPQVKLTPVM